MAERMSATEFKLWRDRLGYVRQYYIRKGILGQQYTYDSSLRRMIDFYRGRQWQHMEEIQGLDEAFQFSVNRVFPIANGLEADIVARNPRVELRPRNPEAIPMVDAVESLVNYDIDELNFKKQYRHSFVHHLFAPAGFIRHGFTPSEEWETDKGRRMQMYRPAKPDRPWIQAVPIWNCFVDPTKGGLHVDDGIGWCAYREIMRLKDIRDNPNMIDRAEIADYAGNISSEWRDITDQDLRDETDPDENQYLEVFSVYDARERKWFQMTLDAIDKPIRNPAEWPLDWETLPLNTFTVNDQIDTPLALSILSQLEGIQIESNLLRSMMGQLVFRLRRLLGVDKNKLEPAEINKIESGAINEIIETNGPPSEAMATMTSGVFPQELLQYEALNESDAREQVGQSKMGRGERINVESATEAADVQMGQDKHSARINDRFEEFAGEVVRLYMQARRSVMDITGEEVVRIVGRTDADGAQEWGRVTPGDLHHDFEFRIVPGSMRRGDEARETQFAANDLKMAMEDPATFNVAYFARRLMEARGIDPARGLQKTALTASYVKALDQMRREAAGGEAGEEGPAQPGIAPENLLQLGVGGGQAQ
jgi:hypothetical protein